MKVTLVAQGTMYPRAPLNGDDEDENAKFHKWEDINLGEYDIVMLANFGNEKEQRELAKRCDKAGLIVTIYSSAGGITKKGFLRGEEYTSNPKYAQSMVFDNFVFYSISNNQTEDAPRMAMSQYRSMVDATLAILRSKKEKAKLTGIPTR